MSNNGKTISLVLGSGGTRGHAHIGVIKALRERGIEIRNIAGTSMGSVIGGIYAANELDTYRERLPGSSLRRMHPTKSSRSREMPVPSSSFTASGWTSERTEDTFIAGGRVCRRLSRVSPGSVACSARSIHESSQAADRSRRVYSPASIRGIAATVPVHTLALQAHKVNRRLRSALHVASSGS